MSTPGDGDALARRRHQVALLRLVVSRDGVLVDVSGRVRGRFGDREALVPILRSWLENEGGES